MKGAEAFIREHVRRILSGESLVEKASKNLQVVRGRVGKGQFKKESKLAGSLADSDPKVLIKKLGIEKFAPTGATAEEKVLSIVKAAASGASVMREAYAGADLVQDEEGVQFIRIKPAEGLSPRDAVQYMFLALTAAAKVGLLAGIEKNITSGLDLEGAPGIFFSERATVREPEKKS